jgi:hypothetical protein
MNISRHISIKPKEDEAVQIRETYELHRVEQFNKGLRPESLNRFLVSLIIRAIERNQSHAY